MDHLINLTPHVLNVRLASGELVALPPSGEIARVEQRLDHAGYSIDGADIYVRTFGAVIGLPDPRMGVNFIVSAIVAQAAPRGDVLSPGELIRDATGQPVGCKGLIASSTEMMPRSCNCGSEIEWSQCGEQSPYCG